MSAGTSRDDRAFERPKVTVRSIREMKARGERIVSVTAYDYPTARLADEAGVDLILVGDSLGMVVLGYESTIPVTMAEMSHHLKAVMRAQPRALASVTEQPADPGGHFMRIWK